MAQEVKIEDQKVFTDKRGTIRISSEAPEKKMSREKLAAAELMQARTNQEPIEVTITGIEPISPSEDAAPVMMPVCMYHGWKIIIPREEFIPQSAYTDDIKTADDLTRRIYRYSSAKIDVIPIAFNEKNHICIASRVKGMRKKCEQMWFAINKVNGEKEYLIKNGSRVEARVVNVVRGAVFIEVFGVEGVVRAENVAWYRLDNCRDKYKPGDTVFVIVDDIKRDEEMKNVIYSASIKDAYADPRLSAFTRYVRGGIYEGRVTMIQTSPDKSKSSGAFVRLGRDEEDRIDCYCKPPKGVMPVIGDYVTVGISDKDPDSKRIWGNILHIERQNQ